MRCCTNQLSHCAPCVPSNSSLKHMGRGPGQSLRPVEHRSVQNSPTWKDQLPNICANPEVRCRGPQHIQQDGVHSRCSQCRACPGLTGSGKVLQKEQWVSIPPEVRQKSLEALTGGQSPKREQSVRQPNHRAESNTLQALSSCLAWQ